MCGGMWENAPASRALASPRAEQSGSDLEARPHLQTLRSLPAAPNSHASSFDLAAPAPKSHSSPSQAGCGSQKRPHPELAPFPVMRVWAVGGAGISLSPSALRCPPRPGSTPWWAIGPSRGI